MARPSLHKELLFVPTLIGTMLFVIGALNISGVMEFVVFFTLLVLTAIPFQHLYSSFFPKEPQTLGQVKVGSSVVVLLIQCGFWIALFLLANYWQANHVT